MPNKEPKFKIQSANEPWTSRQPYVGRIVIKIFEIWSANRPPMLIDGCLLDWQNNHTLFSSAANILSLCRCGLILLTLPYTWQQRTRPTVPAIPAVPVVQTRNSF